MNQQLFNQIHCFHSKLLRSGEIISLHHDKVYIVKEGIVYLWELLSDGSQVLIDILKEGHVVEVAACQFNVYEFRTNEHAEICMLDWEQIHQQKLTLEILQKLRDFSARSQELTSIQRLKYVKDRLINLLIYLSKQYSKKSKNDDVVLTVPITHEEIACAILSTRATITRHIKQLEKEKKVKYLYIRGKRYLQLSDVMVSG
ncbi:Crp/Fnr family transcriptional regulator [Paenactinomyces guangxiensis]|uniref:Crp/Fnr family transcriptional regulator n=1 Tax=Paenactinomyces guangxiensis TaxID=1490290 RepID=A0A7W1WNF6_9BACL|nr:Crp/Fnr family transcriptional regulator [Paenactinomyces guangxiensis]MBA4493135.1 Crp/Fnr family transcriptional regulator [Paenactinomyces guangxiensis]MBH8590015.1 Crp/Fnr family transcriptional regulator [Paenactinomyces guangxiensis]